MPGQAVGAVGVGGGLGGAGAHVGAALLFGHRHARSDAGLGDGEFELGVVFAAGQQGLVAGGELRVEPQRRNDGVSHGNRTHVARLGGPHAGLGRADHVRARPVVGPRRGVQSVADRDPHQLVVGRVVLDLVDAVSVAVVGAQDGPVAVGQLAPASRLPGTGDRADRGHVVQAPLPAFADQSLDEHR